MFLKHAKGHAPLEPGARYKRDAGSTMTEVVEVVELDKDRMGIPHVRFDMQLMRGSYVASPPERRTLALDIFYARYKERVSRG